MSQKRVCGPAVSVYELWIFARLVFLSHPKQRLVGEIIRQCFVKVGHTNSAEGAEPSPSCTQHTVSSCGWVSAHISQWDVKFAGKWDSALKGNSALRAHVARAAGIELAHNRGHYVIHLLWDMRKFYDSIKTHLLSPQLVARCYPLEILV